MGDHQDIGVILHLGESECEELAAHRRPDAAVVGGLQRRGALHEGEGLEAPEESVAVVVDVEERLGATGDVGRDIVVSNTTTQELGGSESAKLEVLPGVESQPVVARKILSRRIEGEVGASIGSVLVRLELDATGRRVAPRGIGCFGCAPISLR